MSYQLWLLKIPVRNVQKSSEFYQKHLGFTVDFVAEEYGWANLSSGDFAMALYEPGKGGGQRTIGGSVDFHLVLDETEFNPLSITLKETGVLVEDMIHTGADGSTFIEVSDPDNNVLKIAKRS
jgi:catechol 2,3-dioxygenase-like lactoylglutathione lyase family enzyme